MIIVMTMIIMTSQRMKRRPLLHSKVHHRQHPLRRLLANHRHRFHRRRRDRARQLHAASYPLLPQRRAQYHPPALLHRVHHHDPLRPQHAPRRQQLPLRPLDRLVQFRLRRAWPPVGQLRRHHRKKLRNQRVPFLRPDRFPLRPHDRFRPQHRPLEHPCRR